MKKDYFYIILAGFMGGIFFRSFFDLGVAFAWFFILLGAVILNFYYIKKVIGENNNLEKIFSFAILIVCVGLGILRFDITGFNETNIYLDNLVEEKVVLTGLVVDEPNVKENNTRLIVEIQDLKNLPSQDFDNTNRIIITTDHYPQYNYGDEINIIGELQKPKNFKTDDTREFDYVSYLAKDGIRYQMFYPDIDFISNGNGNFIKEKLFTVKNAFLGQIRKIIPEPHSSLLGGLVVGAKESLGKDLEEDFRKVGLIHIVVLSGYNITIVAEFIMRIFSFLPYVFRMSFGAISIIFFAIMTGASATIVRASIMALLVVLARATGRVNQITRSLFLAGFIMLLHNPTILVFDPSFQLSFVATLGLIFLAPKIEKYFEFIPTKFQLREAMTATISTQIFVLPLILYMMGDFSIVAIPVNLLVLIFIPLTMLFGFLAGMFSFVSTFFVLPLAYITYGLLAYELKIVEFFSSLPFASINIPYFSAGVMIFIYSIYLLILFRSKAFSDIGPSYPASSPTQL